MNPLLYRAVGPLESWLKRQPRLWVLLTKRARKDEQELQPIQLPDEAIHRAVVIGYGPIGQTVCRLLKQSDIEPTIIEMNLDTVQQLRSNGIAAVYGDGSHRDILQAAGIDQAIALLLTASGIQGCAEAIRLAKELNPEIRVIARTGYLREVEELRQAGADAVFAGEGEVALSLTEFILKQLGATPEQIDRETDRMRNELVGSVRMKKQLFSPTVNTEI